MTSLPLAGSTFLAFVVMSGAVDAQERNGNSVRYELARARVSFPAGSFSTAEMERFARLADEGIADIDSLLNSARPGASLEPPINFVVRDRLSISRSFRRTIMLPAERVRRDAAPYLHETTHVLVPMRQECLWLSEGFASYVQSYVAEHIGGYDGFVFSRGGNRNIDRLARRTLRSDRGREALPWVGVFEQPDDIFEKRREVAEPLYILAHSLVKFMVDRGSLERVKTLVQSEDIGGEAERLTGQPIDAWKAEWLEMLRRPPANLTPTRFPQTRDRPRAAPGLASEPGAAGSDPSSRGTSG